MSWSDAKRPNIAGTHLPLSQQSAELNDKTVYEFRRANGSGLDLVQKFPQIHFSSSAVGRQSNCAPSCLASY
jgi:hypothetical protein